MRTIIRVLTVSTLLILSLNCKASILSILDSYSKNMGISIEDVEGFDGVGAGITPGNNTLSGYDSWGSDCNAPVNNVCYKNKKWHDIDIPPGDDSFSLTVLTGSPWESAAVISGPDGHPSTIPIINYGGSGIGFRGYLFEIENNNGMFDGVTSAGVCNISYLNAEHTLIRVHNRLVGNGNKCDINVINVDESIKTSIKIAQNDAQWRIRDDFYVTTSPGDYSVTWPNNLANSDRIGYRKPGKSEVIIANQIEWQFEVIVIGYLEFNLNAASSLNMTLNPGKDNLANIPFDLYTSFDTIKISTDCSSICSLVNERNNIYLPYEVGFSLSPNPSIPGFTLDAPVTITYENGLRYKELMKGNIFVNFTVDDIDDVINNPDFESGDVYSGSFIFFIEPQIK